MKIKCIHCGEYFFPDEETIEILSEGFIESASVNICDECWEILNQPPDYSDMISDADPDL